MAVTRVQHVWSEPGSPPSVLHIEFDRELTEREASELAQAVAGVHERHEVARDFLANDPHHARHIGKAEAERILTVTPDLDEDGKPILSSKDAGFLEDGIPQVTRTFSGVCADCGRVYISDGDHYVCPSLPTGSHARLRETACHSGCAIDCGRDGFGVPLGRKG